MLGELARSKAKSVIVSPNNMSGMIGRLFSISVSERARKHAASGRVTRI
jgi:hypothetical protein